MKDMDIIENALFNDSMIEYIDTYEHKEEHLRETIDEFMRKKEGIQDQKLKQELSDLFEYFGLFEVRAGVKAGFSIAVKLMMNN